MASSSGLYWPDKRLTEGVFMPSVGLGTYQIKDPDLVFDTVDMALAAGYRMFDTAPLYGNEVSIGKTFKELLPKYNLSREDLFITSKLSMTQIAGPSEMVSADKVVRAYERSLKHLGVEYLDLYLIHYSIASKQNYDDERNSKMRQETWDALVKLYETAKVNAIGVSNFKQEHIEDILQNKHGVIPAVSQFEFNPYCNDSELLTYCQNHRITVQAYHSLGGAEGKDGLLHHPDVIEIAKDVAATPAQVLLVWALEKDIAVIPKATTPEHITTNRNLGFRLTQEHMKILDRLNKHNKFSRDPRDLS